MILSDIEIEQLCVEYNMIDPFLSSLVSEQNGGKILSYGLSSYGYDARIGNEFKIFTNLSSGIIDPKHFDKTNCIDHFGEYCIMPPHSCVLASTLEVIKMPRDVMAICLGKSTYARCGIIVNVTPLEPEWHGNVTIELSNTTSSPVKIYANEGICQFIFLKGDKICRVSYNDRSGKYQDQIGIALPIV